MKPYGLFLFLNYLIFFELCVSEASLINTAGSLQIRVLCQTESLCNWKKEKKRKGKKKKEHTQNIPKNKHLPPNPCFTVLLKSTWKCLSDSMYVWFAGNRNRKFLTISQKENPDFTFFVMQADWEVFICTTRTIHITATQIPVILKTQNYKILQRQKKKKKEKNRRLFSTFPPSHRAVC